MISEAKLIRTVGMITELREQDCQRGPAQALAEELSPGGRRLHTTPRAGDEHVASQGRCLPGWSQGGEVSCG